MVVATCCPPFSAQISQDRVPLMANHRIRVPVATLTSLAVVLGPAAAPEVPVDGVLGADGLALCRARAHVTALPLVLVVRDVVVLHRVQDLGPVQRGQVAEVGVFLDAHGAARDIGEAVQAHLLQLQHLEENQGVVEEQVVAADHRQVGEEVAEALQAVDAEEQQVVGHHTQAREADAAEVLGRGPEHQQDLQVALDHRAVLQGHERGHVVADVLARADWR